MSTSTPTWLKINDENFRDLLEYLCRNAKTKDSDPFYAVARELEKVIEREDVKAHIEGYINKYFSS